MSNRTKAYVLPVPGREREIDLIKRSIMDGGCELVSPTSQQGDYKSWIPACDVLVVLVCKETMEDPIFDAAIDLAARLGKRVIGVWASDSDGKQIPRALHRLGDGVVRLNEKEIAEAVCGGESVWVDPEGEPRVKPPTPRHKG